MPYSITSRQKEYLEFIRQYISINESSPSLDKIAKYFHVSMPTAHKTLEALQRKGFLYFHRSKLAGFYIRLLERAGSSELVTEVGIVGKFDRFGEILEFPKLLGHFPSLLAGAKPEQVFSLLATENIPQAGILFGDAIIFDIGKKPQPNDICIAPIGKRLFLVRIVSRTYDRDLESPESSQDYPIPPSLLEDRGQKLNWYPLAYNEESKDYFMQVSKEQNLDIRAVSAELVAGTALRLSRQLSF